MQTPDPLSTATQLELLGLILSCATVRSASFTEALDVVAGASRGRSVRLLTRELLTDLTIRDWIAIVRDGEDPLPRARYEIELAAGANWDELAEAPRARYTLTGKGREKIARLLPTRTTNGTSSTRA